MHREQDSQNFSHLQVFAFGVHMGDPSSIFTGFFRMTGADGDRRGELTTLVGQGGTVGGSRVTAPEMCPGGPSHWWSGARYPSQIQQVAPDVG